MAWNWALVEDPLYEVPESGILSLKPTPLVRSSNLGYCGAAHGNS